MGQKLKIEIIMCFKLKYLFKENSTVYKKAVNWNTPAIIPGRLLTRYSL